MGRVIVGRVIVGRVIVGRVNGYRSVLRTGINPVSWIISRFDYTTAVLMNLLNIGWCKGYFNGRKKILKLGLKFYFLRSGINHVS